MNSKFLFLISMSFISVGYAANADTYLCNLADPSRGSANVAFSPSTHTVAVQSTSSEMNKYQGLQGNFISELIDQKNASPDLRDDTLIHFRFNEVGTASIRFYGEKIEGGVTVAEFSIGENEKSSSKLSDFALECCEDKYPTLKNYAFSCE